METFSILPALCVGNSPVTGWNPITMASDAELWYFLSGSVTWDTIALIMKLLWCGLNLQQIVNSVYKSWDILFLTSKPFRSVVFFMPWMACLIRMPVGDTYVNKCAIKIPNTKTIWTVGLALSQRPGCLFLSKRQLWLRCNISYPRIAVIPFVFACGFGGCHCDNHQCRQWQQSGYHEDRTLNKLWNKQLRYRWFDTSLHPCDVTVITWSEAHIGKEPRNRVYVSIYLILSTQLSVWDDSMWYVIPSYCTF